MIKLFILIKMAIDSILDNLLGSTLTMLGIIIGISSVIIMIAIGKGAKQDIDKEISSVGSNLIIILPGSSLVGGVRMGSGSQMSLTVQDAEALKKDSIYIEEIGYSLHSRSLVVYRNMNWLTMVRGVNPSFFYVQEWKIEKGNFFSEEENRNALPLAIIGQTVKEKLFGDEDPVEKIIRIKKVPFKIIGVLQKKGISPRGDDQDDVVLIPYRTARRKLFGDILPNRVNIIYVKAKYFELMKETEEDIRKILRQKHKLQPGQENDFIMRNIAEFLRVRQQTANTMSLLLFVIASISLVVGGIGVMNIMLVSVSERTKEIGIRMSVGASPDDIQLQFLIESLILCIFGGIIGSITGILGTFIISKFLKISYILSLSSIFIAFAFSFFVGIFFGYYPAYRASQLNPIDALRNE